MATILVIAPHPDDETLGCGGTLLKHASQGDSVYWVIMTRMAREVGYNDEQIAARQREIAVVCGAYQCKKVFELGYPTTMLDTIPKREIMDHLAKIIAEVKPEIVYLPGRSDIHSDHRVTFEVGWGALKHFRAPSARKIFMYEVLSETEFSPPLPRESFVPNSFSDVTEYLEKKIEIMRSYKGELGVHPFPRSEENIRALATFRGGAAGFQYAEAFMILRDLW